MTVGPAAVSLRTMGIRFCDCCDCEYTQNNTSTDISYLTFVNMVLLFKWAYSHVLILVESGSSL